MFLCFVTFLLNMVATGISGHGHKHCFRFPCQFPIPSSGFNKTPSSGSRRPRQGLTAPSSGLQRPRQGQGALVRVTAPSSGSRRPRQGYSALVRVTASSSGLQRPRQGYSALVRVTASSSGLQRPECTTQYFGGRAGARTCLHDHLGSIPSAATFCCRSGPSTQKP
jgi:hypothetical protein